MVERGLAIGFIGIGVLGKGLSLALSSRGYRVVAAHSRSSSSAQWLADRLPGCRVFQSPQGLAEAADLVFITTPDAVIAEVAAAVKWRPGQGAVHCCGAAGPALLAPAAKQGALTGAFHPFQTFGGLLNPEDAAARLTGATFAVSGEGWLGDYLSLLAEDLGGRPVSIPDEDRPLYHAAGVLACGHLVALMQAAVTLWETMGFTRKQAVEALYPLSRTTLDNVAQAGLVASSTGPVFRGDVGTLRSHLEALFQRAPDLVSLYGILTRAALPLAVRHGVGPDQLTAIEELVDHYTGIE